MHALLAPVLAQLVTLSLADRLEGHYVKAAPVEGQAQATLDPARVFDSSNTTIPSVALGLDRRRFSLTLGYAPAFTIFPLEESSRELLIVHRGALVGQYRFRRSTLSLVGAVSYGERDFQQEAYGLNQPLAGRQTGTTQPTNQPGQNPGGTSTTPNGGTGTNSGPGTTTPLPPGQTVPGTGAIAAQKQLIFNYGSFRGAAAFDYSLSRASSLHIGGGYLVAGGMDSLARTYYPLSRGPDGVASLSFALDGRNTVTTTVFSQYAFTDNALPVDATGTPPATPNPSPGTSRAFVTTLNEDYTHRFTRLFFASAGAGVSFSRTEPAGQLPLYSIYPTARASINLAQRVHRGALTLSFSIATSPVVDLTTVQVDPRVSTVGTVTWTRDRFSAGFALSSTLSAAPHAAAAFNSLFASLDAGYRFADFATASAGLRAAWQTLGPRTLIAPSLITFAAVTLFFSNDPRHPLTPRPGMFHY
jgi:hypothetical protein